MVRSKKVNREDAGVSRSKNRMTTEELDRSEFNEKVPKTRIRTKLGQKCKKMDQ